MQIRLMKEVPMDETVQSGSRKISYECLRKTKKKETCFVSGGKDFLKTIDIHYRRY